MGSGNGTYAWSGPNNFSSTEQNPTVGMAGSYELTVTGANGCTKLGHCYGHTGRWIPVPPHKAEPSTASSAASN
ncbi:MAG: hypothetical protein R2818_14015 [Flavobacteriales bacterium]